MAEFVIIALFGFLALLSIGMALHARSIPPAHEYYEDELREQMGDEKYEEAFEE